MENIKVKRYQTEDYQMWNQWISTAKNATFLFHRDFMEYHSDRFEDYSLLFFKNDILIGVFPAHRVDTSVFSHQGLTYGGLIVSHEIKFNDYVLLFQALLKFLFQADVLEVYIKNLPSFYAKTFSDELSYLQFFLKAELYRKDFCSVLSLQKEFRFSKSVVRDSAKAIKKKYKIVFDDTFDLFWNDVLEPNLLNTYKTVPVHSLEEIQLLKSRFPKQIQQVNVFSEHGDLLGGTTLFITDTVVHSQYISVRKNIENRGVLDWLHLSIFEKYKQSKIYFDFGISNENQGNNINKGLLEWKEKFGTDPCIQEFYKFTTATYLKIDQIYL